MSSPSLPRTDWRLILDPTPARGDWNMAVDEAILEAAGRGDVPPTLRLYAWSPPCLSLGYAQPLADADLPALEARGWLIVRRPTGGRAILHADELTYSVAGPASDPRLAGGVLASYRVLAQALLDALHRLEIPARAEDIPPPPAASEAAAVCFEVPSSYEITAHGKKLVGSAQARRMEGVLQHGSLPLCGDLTRILQALRFPDETSRRAAAERLQRRAITAEAACGKPVTWQQAAQAFIHAFSQTLNLELHTAELTPAERERAAALLNEKYALPDWTERL